MQSNTEQTLKKRNAALKKELAAKNRELEIEAALERVRARTMAMQHSDELKDAAALLFQQVKSLGVPAYSCGYNIWEKDEKEFTSWMSTQDGSIINGVPNIPLTEDANFIRYVESKENGEPFFVLELRGERMQEHYQYLKTIPAFKGYFDYAVSVGYDLPKTQIHHLVNFSRGNLLFITLEPCPGFHDVFKRFAAVFEQTYTRFLDLQKAEAQARESQIQLAMERVRARTMAMQRSEELQDAASVMVQQIQTLGVPQFGSGFNIWDEDRKAATAWMCNVTTDNLPPPFKTSSSADIFLDIHDAAQRGESLFVKEQAGEQLKAHYKYMNSIPVFREYVEKASPEGLSIPDFQIMHCAFFSQGYLMFITYEHVPEAHDIFKRFAKVFEQTYTRFLDLQKAEVQARESQVQLALERVRAKAMAMHHSEEILSVITEVKEQLIQLGFRIDIANFNTNYKHKDWDLWMSSFDDEKPIRFLIPWFKHPIFNDINDAISRGDDFIAGVLSREEKDSFVEHIFENTILRHAPRESKQYRLNQKGFNYSVAFSKNTSLTVTNYDGLPYSDEQNAIVRRLGKAFDQAYTRFLDLQKAEAQAREAQIEAALEKVRSRSLAMHKSDEIMEVARTVFEKLNDLTLEVNSAFIIILKEGSRDSEWWLINRDDQQYARIFVKYTDILFFKDQFEAKEQGKELFSATYHSEEKKELFHYLFTQTDFKYAPPERQKFIFESEAISISMAMTNKIAIQITRHNENAFSQEENEILKRFSKVFDQSYTRFLDLQRAEGQAREAQIELGLERVRARAMAMQTSQELNPLIGTVFTELTRLDIALTRCVILIYEGDEKGVRWWMANSETPSTPMNFFVKYADMPFFNEYLKGWTDRSLKWLYCLEGESKIKTDNFLFNETELSLLPDFVIAGMRAPNRVYLNASFNNFGNLTLASLDPLSEEHFNILLRFAKVFDLTYTRFNDLQKAEAQAREAQIEAALERVRSRTMAMQKSDELTDVAGLLFAQVSALGIKTWTAGFNVWSEDNNSYVDYITSPNGGFIDPYTVHTETADALTDISDARKSGVEFDVQYVEGEKIKQLYRALTKLGEKQFEIMLQDGVRFPSHQYEHFVFGSKVSLMFITYEPVPEAHDIFKRLGKVFEQTYTRFLDLQKAEAQSREAQIETALERVRSKGMAMRSSNELVNLLDTVFRELTNLDIRLDRCIIMIYDPKTYASMWWFANPESAAVPVGLFVKYHEYKPYLDYLKAWKKRILKWEYLLEGANKKEWDSFIFKETELSRLPEFVIQGMKSFDRIFLNVSFNNFGSLTVSSVQPLDSASTDLLLRFAKVFDSTYTRFNDLLKAEAQAKEAQVEAALERVRSRTLAMQKSDELAETSAVLFKQLINLGIEPNRLYISIMKDDEGESEFWITDEEGSKVSSAYTDNLNSNASFKKMFDAWKAGKPSVIIDIKDKELEEYFQHLTGLGVPFKDGLKQKRRIQHLAFFNRGFIGMAAPDDQPEETIHLLERFAAVFNLTFTRFNDLKIAEAHAVQAEQDLIEIKTARQRAEETLTELQVTQNQLIQKEKMASLGELTAGIAHEIQNPLNFVNNFSEVSKELLDEMRAALERGDKDEAEEIANDLVQNLEKINHHGKRADAIVKGMLQHSRQTSGTKEPTDINALCDEYLRLSYHGLRAKDKNFNADFITDLDSSIGKITIVPQDIGRVLLNLYNNAFYATNEKQKGANENYKPFVSIQTKKINDKVEIKVTDNGNGIPQNIVDKIFQPFFTTKPTGSGTGLGLSLSYDIVKAHGGEIKVETKENVGTEFIIQLPA